MRTIKLGAYSATVSQWMSRYVADNFIMHPYGLDIEPRSFKHKSSAVRYAKAQLQIKYDANQRVNALLDYNISFSDLK